ncbi:NAD(P)-dependent oxidoreductase [uncultured Williamsia sp.]|uniref:NAD-dependent epimerase/dehydratase family protein n=1 Tax=uncultured Williamsia sp. TaxID=259311 RepID=UPI00262ABBE7|nr:NAD(P)-dependent oxidoreductase [uncultured Williamsia sp.]
MTDAQRATGPVLVTGAMGLVGSAVVRELCGRGITVVATDLDTPGNRQTLERLQASPGASGLTSRWADLCNHDDVEHLVASTAPSAIIHLAALIPPRCYANPDLSHRINVGVTRDLVATAEQATVPPRFVLASSIAVYGSRNPHTVDEPLTPDTPRRPSDLYGHNKVEAEDAAMASSLDWTVLRLGGVMGVGAYVADRSLIAFESVLPADGRIQTVDVRDVARAFATAATSPRPSGRVYLIGGDDSHRLLQSEVGERLTRAMGIPGILPTGRPGDPDDDAAWFATDWMDTSTAAAELDFQRVSFPAFLDEVRRSSSLLQRLLGRFIVPFGWVFLRATSSQRHNPGSYADPWRLILDRYGPRAVHTPTFDG